MPTWLTWFGGVFAVAAETALLGAIGVGPWSLQTPIALTVLLASYREFVPGALALASLLLPIEWMAGTPPGYYGLGLVLLFLALHGMQRRLRGDRGAFDLIAAGVGAMLHPLVVSGLVWAVEPPSSRPNLLSWSILAGGIAAPMVTWPMRSGIRYLDDTFESSRDFLH